MTYVLFMCVWHVFTMIMYVYVHACLCYVPVYYIHVFVFIYVWTVEYIYTFIYVWVYIDQERVVLQRNEGSGFRVNSVSPDPLPALEAKAKEAKSWTINLRPWTLNPNQALNPEPQTLYLKPSHYYTTIPQTQPKPIVLVAFVDLGKSSYAWLAVRVQGLGLIAACCETPAVG